MQRAFSTDPIPIALASGKPNPMYLHRGPCRGLTPQEEIKCDVVAEAMGRGIANMEEHLLDEAVFEFETAIAMLPNFPYAHWNLGQVLLMQSKYKEGFAEFDWRFKLFGDELWHRGIPIWNGEKLRGKRLLLWHEHGFGDSIQFMRWVPVLRAMGAILTLALPEPLRALALNSFPGVTVLNAIPHFLNFDYRLPFFNLPPAMNARVNNIPPAPYLRAEQNVVPGNAIGISWSGNSRNSREKHRTIGLDRFLELFASNGRPLYAMQTDDVKDAPSRGVYVQPFGDFAQTAKWLMAMEHVVTVDTAVAHLAGALGHPSLHVVVPHVAYWPWYESKAWYGRANVYRQKRPGDWAEVFDRVNAALWS